MAKKSYKSGKGFAKRSSQAKKRYSSQSKGQADTNSVSQQKPLTENAPRRVTRTVPKAANRAQSMALTPEYPYVKSDLKQAAILAAIAFIILIVLAIVL